MLDKFSFSSHLTYKSQFWEDENVDDLKSIQRKRRINRIEYLSNYIFTQRLRFKKKTQTITQMRRLADLHVNIKRLSMITFVNVKWTGIK